jgi:PIN domain nuclease of toxin-antitoxin system
MKLLLDTHVFLWYITADAALPASFLAAIRDPKNQVLLSVASVWEAVIKHALGKLPLPAPPAHFLPLQRIAHGIESLAIEETDMASLAALPPRHRDPFDRLLVAQALFHGLTIVTVDPVFGMYGATLLPVQ